MKIIVDAFGGDNAPLEILKGCVYKKDEMAKRIAKLTAGDEIKRDIIAWVTEF